MIIILNEFKCLINKILCILFCIWISWPYAIYKTGMYTGVLITILWLMTSSYINIFKKISLDIFFMLIFFINFLPYLLVGNFKYGSINIIPFMGLLYLFFIGIVFLDYYMYEKKDFIFLKKLLYLVILFYGIGSIQTYLGLLIYPFASRNLAIENLDLTLKNTYGNLGIGGFNFAYSSVYILIIIYFLIFFNRKKISKAAMIFLSFIFIAILLAIFKASYFISIAISAIGIMFILFRMRKLYFILISFLIFGFYILNNFDDILLKNYTYTPLFEKYLDIVLTLQNNAFDSQTLHRINLYLYSLKTFLKFPIFGLNGSVNELNNSYQYIGGHSGWFDFMGYFGLFVSIPLFLSIYFNYKKTININHCSNNNILINSVYLCFIIHGIVNPILYVYQVGFVVFFVLPLACLLIATGGSNINENIMAN